MARKSRKRWKPEALVGMRWQTEPSDGPGASQAGWRVGIYLRLSNKDNGLSDGCSIEVQEEVVRRALSRMGDLRVVGVYRDNGVSGTSMDRDAFRRLIADVVRGKVNCIAVKDLSRFARNSFEAERYQQEVLPVFGCRLLAVSDGYDSIDESLNTLISTRLRNVANEAHSRDISAKERAAKLARMRAGTLAVSTPPYGYAKSPDDPARLVVVEDRARVVRRIFEEVAAGKSAIAVARELSLEGAETPGTAQRHEGARASLCGMWHASSITSIVRSDAYVGDLVWNQRERGVFAARRGMRPQEERIVHVGAHEPIVTRDLAERARKRLASRGVGGAVARHGAADESPRATAAPSRDAPGARPGLRGTCASAGGRP